MLTIDLRNRVALVAGGSRGIGESITECFCQAGATVVFTHTGNPKYAERVVAFVSRLSEAGHKVRSHALNACDSEATTELVNEIVAQQGRLDVLVQNVGHNASCDAAELDDDGWHKGIDTNLTSAFYSVRAALPHMVAAQYGRILLVGSSAVVSGGGGAIDYAAAKAGLTGVMTYLCKVYTRKGIHTNIIHPCVIETDLLRERYADDEAKKTLLAQIPTGRLGKPEDIAGLAAYLASPWGDYIIGQEVLVDGGRTLFR